MTKSRQLGSASCCRATSWHQALPQRYIAHVSADDGITQRAARLPSGLTPVLIVTKPTGLGLVRTLHGFHLRLWSSVAGRLPGSILPTGFMMHASNTHLPKLFNIGGQIRRALLLTDV